MAKAKPVRDTSFSFGANVKPKARKPKGKKAKTSGKYGGS
jgi:hypothetical protein